MTDLDTDGQESNECPTCGKVLPTELGLKQHHAKVHGESLVETKECPVCGDDFNVRPSGSGKRVTCSRECQMERRAERGLPGKKRQVEITCANCGKEISVAQSDAKRKRYCSMECYHSDSNAQDKECEWCGEVFHVTGSYADKARFCSQDCYGEWLSETNSGEDCWHWKGGSYPYGKGWNESKRERVRERDGHECVSCGMSQESHLSKHGEKLHVHHIVPARRIDDHERRNSMDNLTTLCISCHLRAEKFAPLLPSD